MSENINTVPTCTESEILEIIKSNKQLKLALFIASETSKEPQEVKDKLRKWLYGE